MAEETTERVSEISSDQPDTAKQRRKPRQTSAAAKFWIFVAVVFSLGSLSVAGYMFYRQEFKVIPQFASEIEQIQDVESRMSELSEGVAQQKHQLSAEFQKLVEEIDETGAQLKRLESDVQQSDAQFVQQVDGVKASISAIYENQEEETDDWKLDELIFLMVLAKHRIEIVGDVDSALLVWQVAGDQLQQDSDPRLLDAKLAIENEIAALEEMPTLDLGKVASRLLNLANDVEQLPLNLSPTSMMQKASNENAAPDQPVEQGDSAVSRVLSEVWGDIRSLVRVKKIDLSEQSLLKPDMKIYVVENLKLALFTAQSAAIRSDQQLYQDNLEYVEDAIGQHFSPDSSSVVEFSNEIRELIATDILLDIPDLSRSIELLRQALKSGIAE